MMGVPLAACPPVLKRQVFCRLSMADELPVAPLTEKRPLVSILLLYPSRFSAYQSAGHFRKVFLGELARPLILRRLVGLLLGLLLFGLLVVLGVLLGHDRTPFGLREI